jgi:hypothetical protein
MKNSHLQQSWSLRSVTQVGGRRVITLWRRAKAEPNLRLAARTGAGPRTRTRWKISIQWLPEDVNGFEVPVGTRPSASRRT